LRLNLGDADRADRAQQLGSSISGQAPGGAARDELAQGDMESAGGLGAEAGEVVVAIHQHPDHRAMVIDADRSQPAVAQSGDRGGQGVVRVVLGRLARAERVVVHRGRSRLLCVALCGSTPMITVMEFLLMHACEQSRLALLMKGRCSPLSSHAMTGPRPADASFGS
jgi:hypothetical protein